MNQRLSGGAPGIDLVASSEEGEARQEDASSGFSLGSTSSLYLWVGRGMFRVSRLGLAELRAEHVVGPVSQHGPEPRTACLFSLGGQALEVSCTVRIEESSASLTLSEPLALHQLQSFLSAAGVFSSFDGTTASRQCSFLLDSQSIQRQLRRLLFLRAPLVAAGSRETLGELRAGLAEAVHLSNAPAISPQSELALAESHGRRLLFSLNDSEDGLLTPPWVAVLSGRSAHRSSPRREVLCSLSHPHWSSPVERAPVFDMSATGFSLQTSAPERFPPGLNVYVKIGSVNLPSLTLRARVVHVSSTQTELMRVGFHLNTEDTSSEWARLLSAALYPDLRSNRGECWLMYERSGYLSLSGKSTEEFDSLRADYEQVATALDAAPELACIKRWPSHGAPVCAIAHARVYERTWFLYQVAKDRAGAEAHGGGRDGLYRLYLQAYEHVLSCGGARYLWSFVQQEASPWSLFFHRDVPREICDASYVYSFRALECLSETDEPSSSLPGRTIEPPEYPLWIARLAVLRPSLYLSALDLGDEVDSFSQVKTRWQAHNLERDRAWFAIGKPGEECLVAVVESAPTGLHLYGLLDSLRVYAFRDVSAEELLAARQRAQAWFRARGKKRFVWQVEEDLMPHAFFEESRNGQVDLGRAYGSIVRCEELPRLLDVIHQRLWGASRQLRRANA